MTATPSAPAWAISKAIRGRDTPDGHDRQAGGPLDAADPVRAEDGQRHLLCRCRVGRGGPHIIRALHFGPSGLVGRVDGDADRGLRAEKTPGEGDRHVFLAEMDPGGAARFGHVRMIVDDQGNALGPEAPGDPGGQGDDGRLVQALGPELDDGHAAVDGRVDEAGQVAAFGIIGVGDQIKRIIERHTNQYTPSRRRQDLLSRNREMNLHFPGPF